MHISETNGDSINELDDKNIDSEEEIDIPRGILFTYNSQKFKLSILITKIIMVALIHIR